VIDFRYHIVSLISVFLALAVGIILGAGPLKETIGDQLTGQVDQLRAEKEDIRNQLDEESKKRSDIEEFVSAASKRVARDTLTERRVAVVQLGDVSDELYEAVEAQLINAGATVPARVSIGSAWTDADQADARQSYATSLADYLPADQRELSSDKLLASALIMSMTEYAETTADELSSNAGLAMDVLQGANLVKLVKFEGIPVDAVVIIDNSNASAAGEESPDLSVASALEMNIAQAAARGTEGVVVSSPRVVATDLISSIREDASTLKIVATVTGVDQPVGLLNTPLALSAAIGKKVGHFGFESSATALVPAAVTLSAPERTLPVPPEAAEGDANDANAQDDAAQQGDGSSNAKEDAGKEKAKG